MEYALFGAVTPSYHSLLTFALMPFSLLLAGVLVAGMGGLILLFSRVSAGQAPTDPEPRQPVSAPSADSLPGPANEASSRGAGMDLVERRSSSLANPAEKKPASDLAVKAAVHAPAALSPDPAAVPIRQALESAATNGRSAAGALDPAPRTGRRTSGPFKPGGRFSRSQQAFLRIPVTLSEGAGTAQVFREETCTLILLPQGAVLPMSKPLPAGIPLTLCLAGKEPVSCTVFGVQNGPDGKSLVEVEFSEPQKNFWPVSFPAWAGEVPAGLERRAAQNGARPAHTLVLNESGS